MKLKIDDKGKHTPMLSCEIKMCIREGLNILVNSIAITPAEELTPMLFCGIKQNGAVNINYMNKKNK